MVTASPETFKCPACGAGLTLRAPGFSLTIVCSHCGAALDAQDPQHQRLSRHASSLKIKPLIPLGKRGTLRGEEFEVLGFMQRAVVYYGSTYEWSEYLLYNPYKGYRWLLESNGHWTFLKPLPGGPA